MPTTSLAYRQYRINQQNAIDSMKLRELRKCHLFNEKTFYPAFVKDMLAAKKEVIIYSPFVTKFRSEFFKRALTELRRRNIPVFIFTRPVEECDYFRRNEISVALKDYEELGVCVLCLPGLIHEKVAIIDREILWEGSLNILSQRESRELMRRLEDEESAKEVMTYLDLSEKLAEGYKSQYERLYRNLINNSKSDYQQKLCQLLIWAIKTLKGWLFTLIKGIIWLSKGVKVICELTRYYIKRSNDGKNEQE